MSDNNDTILKKAIKLIDSVKGETFVEGLKASIDATLEKTEGAQLAYVQSAVDLSSRQKQELEEILVKLFARRLPVTYETDKSLLGGFKVQVGDWILDATLDYQLNKMKLSLLK